MIAVQHPAERVPAVDDLWFRRQAATAFNEGSPHGAFNGWVRVDGGVGVVHAFMEGA